MAGSPKVIILSEHLRGQSFELNQAEHVIGRTEDCDICIPDPTVSSHHCKLVREDGEGNYIVCDQGSTNGTRVNGVRIEEGTPHTLVNSDILQVGGVEMLFDCEETRQTGASTTHTVINLEETKTGELPVPEMENFSPFKSKKGAPGRENKKVALILGGVIAALAAIVVIFLVVLLVKLVVM